MQAIFRATAAPIEEPIELHGGMRQAWSQAEQQSQAGEMPSAAPAPYQAGEPTAADAADPASEDVDTPQLQWSA